MLVTADLNGGGAERQLSEMANYWAARGVSVIVASWTSEGATDFYRLDERVRRAHLDVKPASGVLGVLSSACKRVVRLRAVVAAAQPDAVLSFITENNMITILATARLGVRTIVSERAHPGHDTSVPRVWRRLSRWLYSRCDGVVAQTVVTARWLEQHYRVRALVIPNALRVLGASDAQREKLIVGVGRLVRQKGFDLLLNAFARIAASFPEWKVVLIGAGEERDNLAKLCDELSLDTRVTFVAPTRDVESWMTRAGLIVQPSRFEGFPNVVLEAMGLGAAVISADCPAGPAEIIEDRHNGRLVPVENVAALAQAMADLIADPVERARMGAEAMRVRERFALERVMKMWEAALFGKSRDGQPEPVLNEGSR